MSSYQDPYNFSGPSRIYQESGAGVPVARQSRSPQQSCPPTAVTSDHSDYTPPHRSIGSVEDLSGNDEGQVGLCHSSDNATIYPSTITNLQDLSYIPDPYDTLPVTSSQQQAAGYALHTNDGIPYQYHYSQGDYGYPDHQYGYTPYDSAYEYSQQPLVHGADQTSGGFGDYVGQAYRGSSGDAYPYASPPPLNVSVDFSGAMYPTDPGSARPSSASSTLDGALVHTAIVDTTTQHSHHSSPAPVATTSNQIIVPSPVHSYAGSPERKRLFSLSSDDEPSTARRVAPRYDRAGSTASDSRMRSRSGSIVHGRGQVIPQERYTTSSITSPEQHPPIPFDLENPEQVGIPIIDILNKCGSFTRIRDRTQAFSHMGKKTFTLRVQWPGYMPWSKTIAAMDWTKQRAPITRVKLAEAVATAVRDLFEKYSDKQCDPDHAEWRLGPDGIQLDQVCLVAVHQVSRGSWQPQLCLTRPRR